MSEQNITELLHPAFLARMKEMLGEEYDSFIKSYEVPRTYGLRVNTARSAAKNLKKLFLFPVTPIPWTRTVIFIRKMSVLPTARFIRRGSIISRSQAR